jgi:hypothetical protein
MNIKEIMKIANSLSNDDFHTLLSISQHRISIEVGVGKYGFIKTYLPDVSIDNAHIKLSADIGDIDEMYDEHIHEEWVDKQGAVQ